MEAAVPEEGPEEYELLIQGEVARDENITVENTTRQLLYWIGFLVTSLKNRSFRTHLVWSMT